MGPDSTSLNAVDEAARRRFEAAWRAGRPEPIEHFLPPPADARYLGTVEELVHIEIELAWRARGREPAGAPNLPTARVEEYLARFPALNEPPIVLRLVKEEFHVRHRYGDRPAHAEYRARFPDVLTGDELGTLEMAD